TVREAMTGAEHAAPALVAGLRFQWACRERLRDRVRVAVRAIALPSEDDWAFVAPPAWLPSLSYLVRPVRLAGVYSGSLKARSLAPFMPAPLTAVERMLEMAEAGPSDVVYDIGCGDGRVLVTAARRFGARGVGIDIDPGRIAESERNAREQQVS